MSLVWVRAVIVIVRQKLEEIFRHSREAYPLECCGILAGLLEEREVTRVYPCANLNKERARDRYEIDPKEVFRVTRELYETPMGIIGFYHSHPDHPPLPSAFDGERAWEGYSYVIISVGDGSQVEAASWLWDEASEQFRSEPLMQK